MQRAFAYIHVDFDQGRQILVFVDNVPYIGQVDYCLKEIKREELQLMTKFSNYYLYLTLNSGNVGRQ